MATCRARGGRPLTMFPPIRTSPSVASSSPAMVRRSVVLPQPEGPSSTRYSPSAVSMSTPSTAIMSPWKVFLSPRSSTASARAGPSWPSSDVLGCATDQALVAPLREDRLHLRLRPRHRLLRRLLPARRARVHVRDNERAEHLPDRGVRIAGTADVGTPVERVLQYRELVGRLGAEWIVVEPVVQLRDALGVRREVVELRLPRGPRVVLRVVEQEFLRGVGVLRVLRDDPVVHHVLCGERIRRPLERLHEERVVRLLRVDLLRRAIGRDRVDDVGQLAANQALVVGGWVPGEDLLG